MRRERKSRVLLRLAALAVGLLLGTTPAWAGISAVWANNGEDKVTQDETRASADPASVSNSVWNGTAISLFGARNEMVAFNLVIESASGQGTNVSVQFDTLTGPGGYMIDSAPYGGDTGSLFSWTNRNIELFYLRYLQIKGLSRLSYAQYDERHIPTRMRRPWTGEGIGSGVWSNRPGHDKYYPDIAVPIELHTNFNIAAGRNQSVWADIYIPKTAPAGAYTGTVSVLEDAVLSHAVPVSLTVRNFTLPDTPTAKTMVYYSEGNLSTRYGSASQTLVDRHFKVMHRHKLSLIDDGRNGSLDRPPDAWVARLDGSLFTAANGYAGPGTGIGNNVYSIGTYGSWRSVPGWDDTSESSMRQHTDAWENWFATNGNAQVRDTERFLYLVDESENWPETQQWASWIENNPGPGGALMSFATASATHRDDWSHPTNDPHFASVNMPALDVVASWIGLGVTNDWERAIPYYLTNDTKRFYCYNGIRPATGSFATEDDGVALRLMAWAQYKRRVDRWFFWEATYYNEFQGGSGQTDVFKQAKTFGSYAGVDPVAGEYGWNYSNGDGVLLYPGTDNLFPSNSYGAAGPIASLRIKHWRRGIQDTDYLALAEQVDAAATHAILTNVAPKVLWENGTAPYESDNQTWFTWVRCNIGWSIDPDDWEQARAALADIIEQAPGLTNVVAKGSGWKYRPGTSEASDPVGAWRAVAFDDSSWSNGPAPFGYGPLSYGTTLNMQGDHVCTFLRKSFTLADAAAVTHLELDVDYDDGFIVWVNAHEMARVNVDGARGSVVAHDATCSGYVSANTTNWTGLFEGVELPPLESNSLVAVQLFNNSLNSGDAMLDLALSVAHTELSLAEDSDRNRLPDAWETDKLSGPGTDPNGDQDLDGQLNIQEYATGTDPDSDTSYFAVDVTQTNGQVEVRILTIAAAGPGYAGRTRYYGLQSRSKLHADSAWLTLPSYSRVPGDGNPILYTAPTGNTSIIYRARVWLE